MHFQVAMTGFENTMPCTLSVVIPSYNMACELGHGIRFLAAQVLPQGGGLQGRRPIVGPDHEHVATCTPW